MSKAKIKPPRAPKGESPKVTIANQERQINLLITRLETVNRDNQSLEKERDDWKRLAEDVQEELSARNTLSAEQDTGLADMERAYDRLLGWQDCAREMLSGYPQLPATGV